MSMLVAAAASRPESWPIESPPAISETDPILAVNLTFLTGVILIVRVKIFWQDRILHTLLFFN
jgi:hypothetical protein